MKWDTKLHDLALWYLPPTVTAVTGLLNGAVPAVRCLAAVFNATYAIKSIGNTQMTLTLAGGVQVILTWLLPMARAVTLPGGLEGAAVRGVRPVDELCNNTSCSSLLRTVLTVSISADRTLMKIAIWGYFLCGWIIIQMLRTSTRTANSTLGCCRLHGDCVFQHPTDWVWTAAGECLSICRSMWPWWEGSGKRCSEGEGRWVGGKSSEQMEPHGSLQNCMDHLRRAMMFLIHSSEIN